MKKIFNYKFNLTVCLTVLILLLILLGVTSSQANELTRPEASLLQTGSLLIYSDSFQNGWSHVADSRTSVKIDSTSQVKSGSYAIEAQVDSSWGELRFKSGVGELVATNQYEKIQFWVKTNEPLRVKLRNTAGSSWATSSGVDVQNVTLNQWSLVEVSLSESNFEVLPDGKFDMILIQSANGSTPLFYVDQVEFIGGATPRDSSNLVIYTDDFEAGWVHQYDSRTTVDSSSTTDVRSGNFSIETQVDSSWGELRFDRSGGELVSAGDYVTLNFWVKTSQPLRVKLRHTVGDTRVTSSGVDVQNITLNQWSLAQVRLDHSNFSVMPNGTFNRILIQAANSSTPLFFVDDVELVSRDVDPQPTATPIQTATPAPTATPSPPSADCGDLIQEAENGTVVSEGRKFKIQGHVVGSIDQSSSPNDREDDYAQYCVRIPVTGEYKIRAHVHAPNDNGDSFYVRVGDQQKFIWRTAKVTDGTYTLDEINNDHNPFSVNLSAGDVDFKIYMREDGAFIDRFEFVNVNTPPPTPVVPPTPEPVVCTKYANTGDWVDQVNNLAAGDTLCLDPGTYTGGSIKLSTNASASNPMIITKNPAKSGKVIFDGQNSQHHLFDITGSHIQVGGTQIAPGWEPDMVIKNYGNSGLLMSIEANDIRIHHIHFLDIGTSLGGDTGFAVRFNGHNGLFEYNRLEDMFADGLQPRTTDEGKNVDIDNWTIRYNYGHNRSDNGLWAWNAVSHADFIQVHKGPASNINIYGNMMVGYTNPVLLGDSWGSVHNATVENNFMLFEGNGVSTQAGGNISGDYKINNNHLVVFQVDGIDGGGLSAILLNDTGGGEHAEIHCNVFYGEKEGFDKNGNRVRINTNIDGSISVSSSDNIKSGVTGLFEQINSSTADMGYSLAHARDLNGITTLTGPVNGGNCVQGAKFTSVDEHYQFVISQ